MADGETSTDPDFDARSWAPEQHRPQAGAFAEEGQPSAAPPPPPPGTGPPLPPLTAGGQVRERATSMSPREAEERVCQVLAMSGYAPVPVAPGRIDMTVTIKPEPNGIILVVLIVVCLIPGIIYWYVSSRPVHHPVTILLTPNGRGTQILVQGHPDALAVIGPVVDRLPW